MPAPSYEFASFRAMNDHLHNDGRPKSAGETWVPTGKGKFHHRSRGLPSRKEKEAAAVTAAHEEAAFERHGVAARLDDADAAFNRLESTIEDVVREYEEHVIAATAASVLVAKRLSELQA